MAFEELDGEWDWGFLPANTRASIKVFNAQGTNAFQKWSKPRGVSMCYIIVVGGGGGGGGGFSGASTTARGGGAGGACSGIGKMLIPAIFLPDNLTIQVGSGGKGGTGSGVNGGAGANTVVGYGSGITALTSIPNLILQSNTNAPGGGGAGAVGAGGTGGSVPTLPTAGNIGAATSWGIPLWIVGIIGAAGGAQTGAVGSSSTSGWNLLCTTPGAGGAGVNTVSTGFAGGSANIQAQLDFADGGIGTTAIIPGGTAGGAGAAGNGSAGLQFWKPFYMTGGSGGGSSDGSTGGNGGSGGIGCGGGGGGAGVTGGAGGNGGDGLCIIISW